MSLYSHVFEIAFTVETDIEDPDKIDSQLLVQALLRRIFRLLEAGEFAPGDAVNPIDSSKEEE